MMADNINIAINIINHKLEIDRAFISRVILAT